MPRGPEPAQGLRNCTEPSDSGTASVPAPTLDSATSAAESQSQVHSQVGGGGGQPPPPPPSGCAPGPRAHWVPCCPEHPRNRNPALTHDPYPPS